MSDITVKDLSFSYGNSNILRNINFHSRSGEISVFLGRSGVGKTTFLKLIAGLEHPTTGEILKGEILLNGDGNFIPPNRRNIGVVFQEDSLFHHLTIEENIKLARKSQNPKELEELLDLFKISNKRLRFPSELSGGQKQRVAIARAMYQSPEIILFDEPFSALDQNLRVQLRQKVRTWLKMKNITGLFITHDKEEAIHLADSLYILEKGTIITGGRSEDVLKNPPNQSIANFLETGILFTEKECNQLNIKNLSHKFLNNQKLFIPFKYLELTTQEAHGLHCIVTDIRVSLKLEAQVYISIPGKNSQFGPFPLKNKDSITVNDIVHLSVTESLSNYLILD
tara:strand:+ start:3962 stop:4978 length:1017 start_codon:yes stop_codon:yes gene_type:complete